MTAREKRSVVLPSLPPELWDCIFDFATSVPGTLIPDIYEHSNLIGPPYNRKYYPALRTALITKRYLVRVCKQWWHLARRYLYQAIYVGRARCLLSLCNTLKKYAAGNGAVEGVHFLGSWTRRLDIVIRDRCIDINAESECLAEIIRSVSGLEIMSFAITSDDYIDFLMPPSILDALQCHASSLRVLDWSTNRLHPDLYQLERRLLKNLPRLRILSCFALFWENGFMPSRALSSVHTLILYMLFSTLELSIPGHPGPPDTGETPPTLQELILNTEMWKYDLWKQFMRRYGVYLTSVQLRGHYSGLEIGLNTYLELINGSCPNIRRITISISKFSKVSMDRFSLPPVEYLGLRAEAHQEPRSAYVNLFLILAFVKETVPTLRVVQFIDHHNVDALLTRHWKVAVRALDQQLAGSAFRIECHDGTLLSERLEAMGKM
ncbi:hypothetical protein V8B97DRAFT_2022285 [Scleroderma yunnanense]